MTTIRQLLQTGPAKANELFAKLVDTSDGAIKTRERLFADLKAELDLLARLEEEHLFPVLRKHKATKGLVSAALADNKQTRVLLDELEAMPKDDEEFATKVAELRKVHQQSVRDGKNELLPAVLKALSDEEAQAIVEKHRGREGRDRGSPAGGGRTAPHRGEARARAGSKAPCRAAGRGRARAGGPHGHPADRGRRGADG